MNKEFTNKMIFSSIIFRSFDIVFCITLLKNKGHDQSFEQDQEVQFGLSFSPVGKFDRDLLHREFQKVGFVQDFKNDRGID